MKKYYFISITLAFLFISFGYSQNIVRESCGTDMSKLKEFRKKLSSNIKTDNGNPICLRVKINRMVSKDEFNQEIGVTNIEAEETLDRLNDAFAPYNIHFHEEAIHRLKAGDLYYCVNITTIEPLLAESNLSNVINIYLFNSDNGGDIGKSSGVIVDGGTHYIFLAGGNYYYPNFPLYNSKAIVHEMGHTFGLDHTFEGTDCTSSDPVNWENTNGWNSPFAGDMIEDTPADPNLAGNVDANGIWNYELADYEFGTIEDCIFNIVNTEQCTPPEPIANYNPDTHNYMSYTHPLAMSRFSCGQVEKMRDHILNSGLFSQVLVNSSCESIEPDCTENSTIASDMLASFTKTNDNPCLYKIDIPPSLTGCTEVLVDWNIPNLPAQTIDLSQNEVTIEYPQNGNYNIEITILENGVDCGYASGIKNVNCTIDIEECEDCLNISNSISSSWSSTGCTVEVTIPDIEDCFYGRIYWIGGPSYEPLESGTTMTYNYSNSGTYWPNILIYHENDNSFCDKFGAKMIVSCSRESEQINIKLNPNPSKQNQELQFEGIDYKDVIGIEVFDIYGNPKVTMKPKRNAFNTGRLASGVYFVRFTTNNGTVTKKLIIE